MELLAPPSLVGFRGVAWKCGAKPRRLLPRTVWLCRASIADEERLDAARDMTKWLQEQGFPQQPLLVSSFEDKGLGCCATRDLQAGDAALSIPENFTVTAVDVANHPVISSAAEGRDELVGLALWLMYEQERSQDSPWYPYLKVFPASTLSPLLWEQEEQEELLRGSSALAKVKDQLTSLRQTFDALKDTLKDNKDFPMEKFTFSAFKAAFSVVLSRAVYLPSAELFALVPFGDLINHESSRSLLDYDIEEQKVKLAVDKRYKKGDQVFASYAQNLTSADFLIRYGFLDESDENDFIEIEVGLVSGDSLAPLKREILQEVGLTVPQKFPVYLNRFPTQLLTYTRLARIQDSGLFAKITFEKDLIVCQTNEYETLMLLMADCRTKLLSFSDTMEDDMQTLKRKNLSYKQRVAAQLRLKEKRILTDTMSALRNRLAPIRGIPTKSGNLKDPNSDIREMFDMVEQVASAPRKFLASILEHKDSNK
ncbi:hypothetical protein SELMODRAFT_406852 [Selaginella moellendorffii]|uniref:SET domain-containing protein n=1 Tax=Selaginella moellendorffii TaxID=88036 RepID=D8R352_SELML|nr:histone-lysine N-methyltransferase setd3 [Selaginella moellendorffii]EFJ32882.1 hypothetical protein SELMODRAFT_406852 [Selaginella moellendorffii]|eukprot:XP_002965462.1 histone-lysine N-methyltransferase setd3 [Selaginella moellendorffii]